MESEGNSNRQSNTITLRKLRTKTRKPQSLTYITSVITKKKKSDSQANKALRASLKKKKKNIVKKISNQIDFNNYKKIFSSTFSKFEPTANNSQCKSNFHSFYTQVKISTKDPSASDKMEDERDNQMSNFFKNRKENINLKMVDKTQKIFESTMELLDKDHAFLDNFDVAKISNNAGGDMKIKLDQCRKILQKYNIQKEFYTTNNNQKDESIEQHVFVKRLKMYENLKQDSHFSFDDISYDVTFHPKDEPSSAGLRHHHKENSNFESFTENDKTTNEFIAAANGTLDENMEVEDVLVKSIKGSQLDHILKLARKDNKMLSGNVDLASLEIKEGQDKSLGWKIFKNLVVENQESGISTRKSLEIMGSKERFRTQKKNSDFLYYEPSQKKNITIEQDTKRTPRDKNHSNKKKVPESSPHPVSHSHNVNHSADKMSIDDRSDSETHRSIAQRPRFESEDPKSLKMAETLIDDYREVLHHAFRNLSSRDPNFIHSAKMQDEEIEKNTGIDLLSLPQPPSLFVDIKELQSESYLLGLQGPNQPEWMKQQNKSIYTFSSPFSTNGIPPLNSNMTNSMPTPPPLQGNYLSIPVMINTSPQIINQPIQLKPLDNSSNLPTPQAILTPTASFHPIPNNPKTGDPVIPDLRTSPPLKSYKSSGTQQSQTTAANSTYNFEQPNGMVNGIGSLGEKNGIIEDIKNLNISKQNSQGLSAASLLKNNPILDSIINSDDLSNINYLSIFNSLDQVADKIKKPIPYNGESISDRSIKKNNIILTRNNFSNA